MFFPLRDENPSYGTPLVLLGLISATIIGYILQFQGTGFENNIQQYGLVANRLFEGTSGEPGSMTPYIPLITSLFLHANLLHLIMNLWFLWLFGDNIEWVFGPVKFLIFYFIAGAIASLAQAYIHPDSSIPIIGASGAISAVLGAYVLMYPRANILTLLLLGFWPVTFRVTAIFFLGLWFLLQIFFSLYSISSVGGVAYTAHIAGFVAGIALTFLFRDPSRIMTVEPELEGVPDFGPLEYLGTGRYGIVPPTVTSDKRSWVSHKEQAAGTGRREREREMPRVMKILRPRFRDYQLEDMMRRGALEAAMTLARKRLTEARNHGSEIRESAYTFYLHDISSRIMARSTESENHWNTPSL